MTAVRWLGLACIVAAVVALAVAFPQLWSDATTLDRIASVLGDVLWNLVVAAIFGALGTWLLYRGAGDELGRLYVVLGVGSAAVCVALLVSSASGGFFAVAYNPLGILLAVIGTLALVLGVVRALR